jgi:hypothetical protein
MLKRIQNLFLAVSTGLIIAMFFCKMGTVIGAEGDDATIRYYEKIPYLLINIMLLTANVFALFNFKNPTLQARISVIGALLMIGFQIWLGIDFFRFKEHMIFSVTMLFPLAEAFLNIMAARSAMIDGVTVQALSKRKLHKKKRR